LAYRPEDVVSEDIANSRLTRVLRDWTPRSIGYPSTIRPGCNRLVRSACWSTLFVITHKPWPNRPRQSALEHYVNVRSWREADVKTSEANMQRNLKRFRSLFLSSSDVVLSDTPTPDFTEPQLGFVSGPAFSSEDHRSLLYPGARWPVHQISVGPVVTPIHT
jgi:hypothetical protein